MGMQCSKARHVLLGLAHGPVDSAIDLEAPTCLVRKTYMPGERIGNRALLILVTGCPAQPGKQLEERVVRRAAREDGWCV